jgi:hypothetical protein
MKTLKSIFAIAFIGMAALFTGCTPKVDLVSFSVSSSSVTLNEAGKTVDITVTPLPADATVDFSWSSDKPNVATVEKTSDLTAKITAVANGTAIITVVSGAKIKTVSVTVNIGGDPEPPAPTEGDGSQTSPYTVSQVLAKFAASASQENDAWVNGYIVGGVATTLSGPNGSTIVAASDVVFGATGVRPAAVVIADDPNEKDWQKVVVVKLTPESGGTALAGFQDAINLNNRSCNIGKTLKVKGNLWRYFAQPAVREVSAFESNSEPCSTEPTGGFDIPEITISALRAMYQGSDVALNGTQKIVGVVTSDLVGGNSTSKKNLIITALDNQSGMMIRFIADNATLNLGDKVEVKLEGSLTMYSGQYQLSLANANVVKTGTNTITPRVATIEQIAANISSYDYCVVTTEGVLSGPSASYGSSSAHQTDILTDGGNKLDVFVARYSTFVAETMPTARVRITGIAQSYGTDPITHQLIIRNLNDVVLAGE